MRLLAAMFLGMACLLGGCAIPRTAYMAHRIREEIPVVPQGSMKVESVEGSAIPEYKTPGGVIDIHSPLTAVQTYEWYRAALLERGWKLTRHYRFSPHKDSEEWEPPVADEKGDFFDTYCAERKGRAGREALMFHLMTYNAPEGGCNLQVFFDGWYVWDMPTWIFNGMVVYPLIPVLQEGFLIVTPPLMLF